MKECILTPNKLRYKTEKEAWLGGWKVWKKHLSETTPYKCPSCEDWHLTGKPSEIPKWMKEIIKKDPDNPFKK